MIKMSELAMNASHISLVLTLAAGTGIALASPAAAQTGTAPPAGESASSGSGGLEEIVVTARRRAEALQSVPVAVTALSGEDLQRKNIASIENLSAHVPALRITKFQGSDTLVVSIRGQRNSQVQPGQDPAIGVYFAEVPTGFQQGLSLGVFDLENVQVLKGPQGTLFGRNSTGGAILLSPAKPKDEFGGSVRGGMQSFRGGTGWSTTTILNIPAGERIAFRFALNTVDRQGWQNNVADPATVAAAADFPAAAGFSWPFGKQDLNKRTGNQHSQEWRASMNAQLTDQLSNYLVYQGAHFTSNGLRPHLTLVLPGSPFAAAYAPVVARQAASSFWSTSSGWSTPTRLNQHQLVDILSLELDDITLKNILGAKWLNRKSAIDSIGSPLSQNLNVVNNYPQKGHEISEEFQVQGNSLDSQLTWTIGAFYFKNVFHQQTQGSGFGYTSRPADATARTIAGFGQATYKFPFLEGLSATAGARYTSDRREMTKSQVAGAPPTCRLRTSVTDATIPAGCLLVGSADYKKWTYNGSLDFQFDPHSLIYLSYAKGYRSGGFSVAETTLSNFLAGYKPETVYNLELGLKKDWDIGFPVRTNIAAYTQKFKNVVRQAQNPGSVIGAILTNASDARLKGIEAEITIKPFRGFDLGVAYGYVDARYTAPFLPFGGTAFNAQGFEFSVVPKSTVTVNGSYTLPLDEAHGEVTFGASYYHQSRMWWDDSQQGNSPGCVASYCGPLDSYTQKPYGTLDLRLDWRNVEGSNFDVALWATNVTKTKYDNSGISLANVVSIATYAGEPRFIGADVTFHFGKR